MNCENCSIQHDGKYGSGRFCSKFCSSSYSSNKNKELKNKKISDSLVGRFTGLQNSVYKSNRFEKQVILNCPICKSEFNKSYSKIYCSRSCYLLDINSNFRKKASGGYRKGSGIGKKGWYKGYWCDSSWELAWVVYNIDHGIKFERNFESFKYNFQGKEHNYYPDFKIDDTFFEIKGYITEQSVSKLESFKNKIELIDKNKIKPFLKYVIEKYGKDFIKLYD